MGSPIDSGPPGSRENIAETVAREARKPVLLEHAQGTSVDDGIVRYAVPQGFNVEEYDDEELLAAPRRIKGQAVFGDVASFVEYVMRFDEGKTAVWCDFKPGARLSFAAVLNDVARLPTAESAAGNVGGWRDWRACYTPELSKEWLTWNGKSGHKQGQVDFATFLEDNNKDVYARSLTDSLTSPTSAQMLELATNFSYRADKAIKSIVKLRDGGTVLEFIDTADDATEQKLKVFERFWIAIPVWAQTTAAYPIEAKLRTPRAVQTPQFSYELTRPDLAHETAAKDVIAAVKAGIGEIPFYMGSMSL